MSYDYITHQNGLILTVRRSEYINHDEITDNLAPMLFRHGGSSSKISVGDILDDVDSGAYVENRRALGAAFGWTEGDWIELLDDQVGYEFSSLGDLLMDKVRDQLSYEGDNIDLIEEVAKALGIVCVRISGHSYCQGDVIDALAFASQDYIKKQFDGKADKDTLIAAMKKDGETYTAWAFGDVYDADVFTVPNGLDLTDVDDDDLEEVLDDFDPDWAFSAVDGVCIIEQMPDFDCHPDIHALLYQKERLCA